MKPENMTPHRRKVYLQSPCSKDKDLRSYWKTIRFDCYCNNCRTFKLKAAKLTDCDHSWRWSAQFAFDVCSKCGIRQAKCLGCGKGFNRGYIGKSEFCNSACEDDHERKVDRLNRRGTNILIDILNLKET